MNSLELLCVSVKLLHVFALTVLPSNICDCSSDANKKKITRQSCQSDVGTVLCSIDLYVGKVIFFHKFV